MDPDKCPNCGEEWLEEDVPKEHRCPTCGTVGYDCCFPAGALTDCIDCEENPTEEINE
jgi:hypothetical protein